VASFLKEVYFGIDIVLNIKFIFQSKYRATRYHKTAFRRVLFDLDGSLGVYGIKPAAKSRDLSASTHGFPHTTIQGSLTTGSIPWIDLVPCPSATDEFRRIFSCICFLYFNTKLVFKPVFCRARGRSAFGGKKKRGCPRCFVNNPIFAANSRIKR